MLLRLLPLVTGILPILAIHGAYFLAVVAERVPACVPYLHGCTSISATGRYPPASYLFKAVMLPEAVFLIAFWILSAAWLRALARCQRSTAGSAAAIAGIGTGGAIALVLYVTFLGTQEPFYELMRRFGVYVFFLLSVVAQLLLAVRVKALAAGMSHGRLHRIATWQQQLAMAPLFLGLLNVILKATLDDADTTENAIEWIAVLLMQAYIVLSYFAWTCSGFTATFRVDRDKTAMR